MVPERGDVERIVILMETTESVDVIECIEGCRVEISLNL
jgi:hypothetical protein